MSTTEYKYYEFSDEPIQGIKWLYYGPNHTYPACMIHGTKLFVDEYYFECKQCGQIFQIPHNFKTTKEYMSFGEEQIAAAQRKRGGIKTVRVDSEGRTILAEEHKQLDPRYFIDAQLADTQKGLELIVEVGKRNDTGQKVQLFVEPTQQHLSSSTTDKAKNQAGIFTRITAQFKNSSTTIEQK